MPSIPQDYRTFIAREIGPLADGLADCLEQTAPAVAVRVNRRKLRGAGVPEAAVPAVCRGGCRVSWWPDGYLLPERPDFTHDPAMHQGLYYVQDASSMITAHVVEALSARLGDAPLLMLDACAAPGGKSTAALDALPEGSMLVANEFDFRRASILAENIQKWGAPAVAVSRGDTARFRRLPELFDIVAADVPCSGEGMMRKDAQACAQWSERLVDECAARQWEIIGNLWETLATGGFFVYSTCTFNTRENEQIADRMIAAFGAEPVAIPLPEGSGIVVDGKGRMRFLPTRLRGEGFFMAILRKPGEWTPSFIRHAASSPRREKKKAAPKAKGANTQAIKESDLPKLCSPWLAGDFDFTLRGEMVFARPTALTPIYNVLERQLDLLLPGVEVATAKGRSLVPSQALALSTSLTPNAFPTAKVDSDTAIAYLRRESLPSFPDYPRGPLLLTHRPASCASPEARSQRCGLPLPASIAGFSPLPLGFVNNLGSRANNLYPSPWRILH